MLLIKPCACIIMCSMVKWVASIHNAYVTPKHLFSALLVINQCQSLSAARSSDFYAAKDVVDTYSEPWIGILCFPNSVTWSLR